MVMNKQYVEERDGAYRIAGTRVSLDSVIYSCVQGDAAETIAQSFPALTLEQVYGGIAFYLSNRRELDAYLRKGEAEFDRLVEQAREKDPFFYQKLADAQRQLSVK
jgi:uncharacterized protein (DUF433 family)